MSIRSLLLAATSLALALGNPVSHLFQRDTNPNAQGACSPTQGGSNACGPNGSEDWLNTGLSSSAGWDPPYLDINSITHIPLSTFYANAGSACSQYDSAFQASGAKYNIDPAILAFLAIQESSCNADAGGSTPGLMQCDASNCQNGQGSCQYPVEDNTDCGAFVLRQALDAAGGNAVHALGSYNGWFTAGDGAAGQNGGKGLTVDYPCGTGRQFGDPQNLNYVHEVLNGWFQGYDMYGDDAGLDGSYQCTGDCGSGSVC